MLIACRKEGVTTDPSVLLSTTTDTLRFDTVFATTGSATQVFKIFNPARQGIRITSVRLFGGAASPFKINVNGMPGPLVENLEIGAADSAYVFVMATIPASTATTPFLLQDSIELSYNGNKKWVQLEAYGQNAHFLRAQHISGNNVWTADLPYVVLGPLTVESGAHLTIREGCKLYFHADAPLVVKGTLTVQGDHWDSTRVLFTGDRLDAPYRDLPGSWPGIVFKKESGANNLRYAVLKNAYQAIAVEASPVTNKLTLHETIIDNAFDAGILATNATITAQNVLISNCGRNLVLQGGNYSFTHATIASFSTKYLPHKQPVLSISNTIDDATTDITAMFRNCIFWGESGGVVPDEVVLAKTGTAAFNVTFDGVLWPLNALPGAATATVPPINQNPEFDSISIENNLYDFHLKETSPAVNSGVPSSVSLDLDGKPRPAGKPDLGAYEKQ